MESRVKFKNRIWELDFLRGIALILMIYFHLIYDLKEFYNYTINYQSGINFYLGRGSAILFMLLAGISSSLSRSNLKRGLKVLAFALVISLISHLYDPAYGVKFGILHFLGISMLLAPWFIKINKHLLLLLGTFILLMGNFMSGLKTSLNYLFPLGIINNSFNSSDYYPLIPWLGIFLYGISLGKFLYAKKQSLLPFTIKPNPLNKMGEKSLLIYLIHQPLIIVILNLLKNFKVI